MTVLSSNQTSARSPVVAAFALVGAVWLYLFPYSAALNNPNERTRVLQARTLVAAGDLSIGAVVRERGRLLYVDPYGKQSRHPFVNDVAVTCQDGERDGPGKCAGPLYPAKAPGTALLGVPLLAAADALGLIPAGPDGEPRATWVLRLAVALFCFAGLWAVSRLLTDAGVRPGLVAGTVAGLGLGSSVLPYGITFVGHAAAGAAIVLGLVALGSAAPSTVCYTGRRLARTALAGALVASAVLFEYHALVMALPVALLPLLRRDWRALPGFAVGGGAMAALHLWLHDAMFGGPFRTGHLGLVTAHNRESQAGGFLGLDGLHLDSLGAHLFDGYMGLGPTMPWILLLGGLGLVRAFSRDGALPEAPSAGPRALAVGVLLYLVFVSSLGNFRVMNGWSFGPRYLVPALMPLAVLAGLGWEWLARRAGTLAAFAGGTVGFSIVVYLALTAAYPSPPNDVMNPFAELALPLLKAGYGVRNLGAVLGGAWIWPLGAAAAAAIALVTRGAPAGTRAGRHWALAAIVTVLLVGLWSRYRPTAPDACERALAFMKSTVEGVSPDGHRPFFSP